MFSPTRSSTHNGPGVDHDEGLDHPHEWARERGLAHGRFPVVADASKVPAPSSVLHDDALYAGS